MLALERAEPVATPPAFWFQGTPDPVHDYRDPDAPSGLNEPERFAENYRRAGGSIEIAHVDQADRSDPALLGFAHRALTQALRHVECVSDPAVWMHAAAPQHGDVDT